MFTGLIEVQGEVLANVQVEIANRLLIKAELGGLKTGESIAINGVCLTLLPDTSQGLAFDVSPETLKCTSLGSLKQGDAVNLERAMLATARFGGHYVSGHVDTTVTLKNIAPVGDYIEMILGDFLAEECKFLLPKGSITLEGVSLTINAVKNHCVSVLLVPHTLAKTTLGARQPGDRLNVEFDYMTRIVAHQLSLLDLPALTA
ncbi:riboflavin synthase [Legionella septentrionalis]|uniref:riboflavin synthase n=1 Tax=Legionella septentrionalis TaxID=2498109 RepID=UPI000F8C6A1A|nr:riboflavin synthase [Legionella septentrionalis]RUR08585.1 riboflavin synthase [Legionella septentrionalis]RUR14860.1 riboflavin synthase [Legionella septentrionalis]